MLRTKRARWSVSLSPVLGGALLVFLARCPNERAWVYSADQESDQPVLVQKSLSVPPFKDRRADSNSNCTLVYMVPLMPFGWVDYSAPEKASTHINSARWAFRPEEDLAKAAAAEISSAHLFKEAFFTNRASEGDLLLEGEIRDLSYGGAVISYGLSVYGPLLWLFGFPASVTSNGLKIDLALKSATGNQVLWKKS